MCPLGGSWQWEPFFCEKLYIRDVGFPGEVYLDPQSTAFKAASLKRTSVMSFLWSFITNGAGRRFYNAAAKKHRGSNLKGDGLQTGGVFVVGPGADSDVIYESREYDKPGSKFVEPQELLEALGWKESMPEIKVDESGLIVLQNEDESYQTGGETAEEE